ncbi:MAG: hypothetical protein GY934_03780, partial [Gammaproteobacteria bacterium]|nr:hypothetical protein [Gammaproteobacteria bacterium]
TSATLRLYALDNSNVGFDIKALSDPTNNSWDELTITHNNAPTIGSIINGVTSMSKNSWVEVDVTSAVTDNGLVTFALTSQGGSRISFGSRESAYIPELVIQYGSTTSRGGTSWATTIAQNDAPSLHDVSPSHPSWATTIAQNDDPSFHDVSPSLPSSETTIAHTDTSANLTDATAGLMHNEATESTYIAPPTKHTGTMRLAPSSLIPHSSSLTTYPTFITVQTLNYDAYGNVTWVKDGNNNQTSFVYDTTYHLYMVSTSNDLGQTQTFGYYQLNASKDDHNPLPGLLRETTDPNGLTHLFFYDPFGRLQRKFRTYPGYGGDWNYPAEAYAYYDYNGGRLDGGPFLISSWRQTQDDGVAWSTGGVWERQLFDGFGNLVQVQRPHTNWNENGAGTGQDVVIDTTYDALGRAISQSVPYFKATYTYATDNAGFVINPYHTPDNSQPRTTTTYDAANRPVESVGLDGAVTNSIYGNRSVYVQDGNNHLRASFFDEVGQLVKVDETIDTFS